MNDERRYKLKPDYEEKENIHFLNLVWNWNIKWLHNKSLRSNFELLL